MSGSLYQTQGNVICGLAASLAAASPHTPSSSALSRGSIPAAGVRAVWMLGSGPSMTEGGWLLEQSTAMDGRRRCAVFYRLERHRGSKRLPVTLTLSSQTGRGDVPCETLAGNEEVAAIPFAPQARRRCRQADEGGPTAHPHNSLSRNPNRNSAPQRPEHGRNDPRAIEPRMGVHRLGLGLLHPDVGHDERADLQAVVEQAFT